MIPYSAHVYAPNEVSPPLAGQGMFDISKYHNNGTRQEMNCKEHYDPGLLSLSIRSTEPGLQMKDEFGRWIITPNDKTIGILWAGKAAVTLNPTIKPGIHRVKNTTNKPRIGIWYEICTTAQEHTELLSDKKASVAKLFEGSSGISMSKSMSSLVSKEFTHSMFSSDKSPRLIHRDRYMDMAQYSMNQH